MNMNNPGRKLKYIYGIKGVACLGVMVGHVISEVGPLLGESVFREADLCFDRCYIFWNNVAMFALVSGFLVAKSSKTVNSVVDCLRRIVKRYFRFCIPVFGSIIFAFVLSKTIGFDIRYEPFGIVDMLKYSFISVFRGNNSLNPAFWMMGDIFWGSVICITLSCMKKSRGYRNPVFFIAIMGAFAWLWCFISLRSSNASILFLLSTKWVIWDVLLGMLVYYADSIMCKWNVSKREALIIVIFFLTHISGIILRNNYNIFFKKQIFFSNHWLQFSIIGCIIIFLCIKNSMVLNAFFSSFPIVWLGKRSFWIFALHYPIICSITYKIALKETQLEWNSHIVLANAILSTVILTVVFSSIFFKLESAVISYIGKDKKGFVET